MPTITCPFCDHSRQIPNSFPGKHAKCPKCGTFVPIPAPDPSAEEMTPQGITRSLVALLIALGILLVFVLGAVAMLAMRSGGD
jgi:uncharacterized paraquat-inducible protein A